MSHALKGVPEEAPEMPEGVVSARIDPQTGLRTAAETGVLEYFYAENVPPEQEEGPVPLGLPGILKHEDAHSDLY